MQFLKTSTEGSLPPVWRSRRLDFTSLEKSGVRIKAIRFIDQIRAQASLITRKIKKRAIPLIKPIEIVSRYAPPRYPSLVCSARFPRDTRASQTTCAKNHISILQKLS